MSISSLNVGRSWRLAGLVVVAGFCLAIATEAQRGAGKPAAPAAPAAGSAALIARGDYITHHVAMCVECHSPRDERGNIIANEEFTGAPVLVSAPYWRPDWAQREPNIAGLPGFTDEQAIEFLMTGRIADRQPPKRPMPPFRMTREDAEAVVAYLKSR